jgi:DNA-binding protein YbaB
VSPYPGIAPVPAGGRREEAAVTAEEQAERVRADLLRQHETIMEALAQATDARTTHEAEAGQIRVSVDGRLRIAELYVAEQALRSPDAAQRVVTAVNEALDAARHRHADEVASRVDATTSALMTAAGNAVDRLREGAEGGYR